MNEFSDFTLFVRRWMAHPLRVAAVLPSSPGLARLVARHAVSGENEVVLEVGAGTGAVSQALVAAGLPEDRLIMVEIDPDMAEVLTRRFPRANILLGDAREPGAVVPDAWAGRITTVVSGLPLVQFPLAIQRTFVRQCFQLMGGAGRLFQYSHMPVPPLPHRRLGMSAERMGFAWGNFPPGVLWRFESSAPNAESAGEGEVRYNGHSGTH